MTLNDLLNMELPEDCRNFKLVTGSLQVGEFLDIISYEITYDDNGNPCIRFVTDIQGT